tara:strand:+ start:180 stop:578 length:399 start_codon:yes stop_codon:yes gene_type:complete
MPNSKRPDYVTKSQRKGVKSKEKWGASKRTKTPILEDNSADLAWITPTFLPTSGYGRRIYSSSSLYVKCIEEKERLIKARTRWSAQKYLQYQQTLKYLRSHSDNDHHRTYESDDDDHPDFICDGCPFGCEYC